MKEMSVGGDQRTKLRKELEENRDFWLDLLGPDSNCTRFFEDQLRKLERR